MNARIAPPPICPGPKTLNGRTVTVGRPSSSWYACAMCSPASFETAYVQRASPTEPIVVDVAFVHVVRVRAEDLARREVDEALERVQRRDAGLEHVVRADHVHAHRAHRALEHGVDARDRCAVDDVRRAGGELLHRLGVEDVALVEGEVRVLAEICRREGVAVEVVDAR